MNFRLDIQGLRAVAVLAVFIFHLNQAYLPGGFLGVDIFFVISGFLISGIIINKIDKKSFSFIDFYKSRIKRIVPAYLVLLIIVAIAVTFIYFNQDVKFFRKALFNASIFNSNNYFASLDTYFGAQNSENPLLHTWTLAVEMQFYLILPLILFFIPRKWLGFFIVLLILLSLMYTHYQISFGKQVVAMYYSLLSRSSEFLLGTLVQLFLMKKKNINISTQTFLSVLGLLMVLIPMFIYDEKTTFPGVLALIPCAGTGMLLISKDSYINQFLSTKIPVFIGALSYSIYLWHWPFMALYRYYHSQYEIPLMDGLLMTILIFAFSYASYYLIEEKFRIKSIKQIAISSVAAYLFLAFMVLMSVKINEKMGSTPAYFSSSNAMGFTSHGKYFKRFEVLGNPESTNKILVIGDSHGLVMKPFLNEIGKKNDFAFSIVTNDTYPPIPNISEKEFHNQSNFELYENLALKSEKEIEKFDTIFILKAWGIPLPHFNEALLNLTKRYPQKIFYLFEDYPTLNKNPIRVNRGELKTKKNVKFEKIYAKIPENILKELKSSPNVKVMDLTKIKLFEDAPYYKDTVIYYDEKHLNVFGSIKYAKFSEEIFLKKLRSN